MNTHADKTQENKSQAVANNLPKQQSSNESDYLYVDNRPKSIAQRKLQESINNSSVRMQPLKAYQKMAYNNSRVQNFRKKPVLVSGEGPPIQPKVMVGNDTYENQEGFNKLLELFTLPQKKGLAQTSKVLRKWVLDDKTEHFNNIDELYEKLIEIQTSGRNAKEKGVWREVEAGGSAGLEDKNLKRGHVLYENNNVKLCKGHGDQDNYLVHPTGSTVPLDKIESGTWGLVGGPAKAKSEDAVAKEIARLTILKKCCETDGIHTAEVHYFEIPDQKAPLFAKLLTFALKCGIKVYVNDKEVNSVSDEEL